MMEAKRAEALERLLDVAVRLNEIGSILFNISVMGNNFIKATGEIRCSASFSFNKQLTALMQQMERQFEMMRKQRKEMGI